MAAQGTGIGSPNALKRPIEVAVEVESAAPAERRVRSARRPGVAPDLGWGAAGVVVALAHDRRPTRADRCRRRVLDDRRRPDGWLRRSIGGDRSHRSIGLRIRHRGDAHDEEGCVVGLDECTSVRARAHLAGVSHRLHAAGHPHQRPAGHASRSSTGRWRVSLAVRASRRVWPRRGIANLAGLAEERTTAVTATVAPIDTPGNRRGKES